MTAVSEALDIKEFLLTEDVPLKRFHEVRTEIHCHVDLRNRLEALLADFGDLVKKFSSENRAEVRKGVGRWLLGQVEEAVATLAPARAGKERSYFLGLSLMEAGRPAAALEPLKEALEGDSSDPLIAHAACEAKIRAGKIEEAESHVEKLLKKKEVSAETRYLQALLADMQGCHDPAMQAYEKALELEPGHAKSLFRLAYIMDLSGEDARALELYEQLRKMRPMHLHTMMNLGVLYEDRGDYEKAAQCYQGVLDYFPNHSRAQLYLKDARAAMTMFYDEDAARREAKMMQVLGQPVAEVSFSPRVRAALQKLGVNTLGDLVGRSEEDMLSIPNFGRTSLRELKEFLSSKGLSMQGGGGVGGEGEEEGGLTAAVSATAPADVAQKNLSDMEWAGRIRKVFEKMGLVTVGDLLARTEKDLLKSKNLGVTSIKEIRRKLGQLGVGMREE